MFVKLSEWANLVLVGSVTSCRKRSGLHLARTWRCGVPLVEDLESRELLAAVLGAGPTVPSSSLLTSTSNPPIPATSQSDKTEVSTNEVQVIPGDVARNAPITRVIPRIINGAETADFPSVGIVGDRDGGYGTGTLIAPDWVLTAAHTSDTLTNTSGRFTIGGVTYETEFVVMHARWNRELLGKDGANDIALWKLSQPVVGIEPSPLYTGSLRLNQTLTLVGYGYGGDAENGETGEFGTKRIGTTPIDHLTSTLISFDFDNPAESNTAHGDSGGPAFVNVGGVYYVAGVTSGGTKDDASLGDLSYDTRVSAYSGWIKSVMGGSVNWGVEDDFPDQISEGVTTITLSTAGSGSISGRLNVEKDIDVFRLSLPQSALTTLTLRGTNGTRTIPDPELTLMDETGVTVATNDNWNDDVEYSQLIQSLPPGTYYLQVNSSGNETKGTYRLSVEALADRVGDSIATAVPMAFNKRGGVNSVSSQLNTSTDIDVFSFIADRNGDFDVRLRNLSVHAFDPVVTLTDSAGNVLGTTLEHGPSYSEIRFRVNLDLGQRYFVHVQATDGGAGRYSLDAWYIRAKKAKKGKK